MGVLGRVAPLWPRAASSRSSTSRTSCRARSRRSVSHVTSAAAAFLAHATTVARSAECVLSYWISPSCVAFGHPYSSQAFSTISAPR